MVEMRPHPAWILGGTAVAVVVLGAAAYWAQSGSKSFASWLNGDFSWESLAIGMVYGLVFGFIDSVLLLIGVDGLTGVYEKLPGGRSVVMASLYGNTFSSVVSGFGSAFLGDIVASRVRVHDGPVWGQPIGLFLGCAVVILGRLAFAHRPSRARP